MSETSSEIIERYFGIGSTLDLQTGTIGININNLPGTDILAKSLGITIQAFSSLWQYIYTIIDMPIAPNSFGFYSRKYELEVKTVDYFEVFCAFLIDKTKGLKSEDYLDLEIQSKIIRADNGLEITVEDYSNYVETDPSATGLPIYSYKEFSHLFVLRPNIKYILEISSNYPVTISMDVYQAPGYTGE